jgi:hypothetical protein
VPLRCGHGGELRDHRGREQRWFTMANGVVSQKGDSGGPVYNLTPDGRAAIVGMFNSTWGPVPGGGVVAGRQPTGREGRHLRARGSVNAPTRPSGEARTPG